MKKISTTIFALALSFGVFAQQTDTIATTGCNQNAPGWGSSLGRITFHGQGHNAVIQGNGINQTWSGAVTATACQKTTFAGGLVNNFNADCRSNPDHPGDLFSWCAVVRFANQLCPAPWRVPTLSDFRNLDIALGGIGENANDSDFRVAHRLESYINVWGGSYVTHSGADGMLSPNPQGQRQTGSYWSQTERSAVNGICLFLTNNSAESFASGRRLLIVPSGNSLKNIGRALRCVRDN